MEFLDDSFYIEKVVNGDTSAYTNLVNKHKDMVFTIALRIARNHQDAEEIAQDVFLKAFQSLESFKHKSKFSTWLYRIVYNTAISKIRKKQPEVTALDENLVENYTVDNIYTDVNSLDDEEQKKLIKLSLDKLKEDESSVISLYYLSECSVEEISEITGMTKSNVKVKLHRTRKKLYAEMQALIKVHFKELR